MGALASGSKQKRRPLGRRPPPFSATAVRFAKIPEGFVVLGGRVRLAVGMLAGGADEGA
jgi:hypothetical protein